MTTIPNVARDTRMSYWRKILQKYQNQSNADPRNNINFNAPLRRVQLNVLKAISGSRDPRATTPLRRLEGQMIRAVIKS